MDPAGSPSETVQGAAAAATGLGLLTFTLFPFALPLLILTIAATLPLVLPLAVFGAVAAILWAVWLAMRAAGRGLRRLRPRPGRATVPRRPQPEAPLR